MAPTRPDFRQLESLSGLQVGLTRWRAPQGAAAQQVAARFASRFHEPVHCWDQLVGREEASKLGGRAALMPGERPVIDGTHCSVFALVSQVHHVHSILHPRRIAVTSRFASQRITRTCSYSRSRGSLRAWRPCYQA